jgi:hypothetical protein
MPSLNIANLQNLLKRAGSPWSARANKITALDDAARARLLGVVVDRKALAALAARPRVATAIVALPAAIDWRNVAGRNHISPVKDQLGCGSCVSFCVCATIESVVSIAAGEMVDLSEADLHFCSAHGANCGGWWPSDAINEAGRRGAPVEELFPYNSAFDNTGNPSCRVSHDRDQRLYRPSGQSVLVTTAERKQWLASRGPVCAVFHVYDDFFPAGNGVYWHLTGDHAGYHCVEIVGYSDVDRCWIAKNSWGADWGDGGFVRIGYGECGIDDTRACLQTHHGPAPLLDPALSESRVRATLQTRPSNDRDPDGSLNRFPMFGIEGVQIPGGWRGFELAPAGSASLNGGITAVSRIPNSMEVWWVGANGSVQDAFWYEGGQWQRFELAPAGSASVTGGYRGSLPNPG